MTVAIIGAGRAGTALRAWLRRLDCRVPPPLRRGVWPGPGADAVVLAVPDDALAGLAAALARLEPRGRWRGKYVLHLSGAQSADVLQPLRRAGAHTAALHPMMTFGQAPQRPARPSRTQPAGVVFGLEGDAAARRRAARWIAAWGGEALPLTARQKAAYHLACTLVSPAVVVNFAAAEAVLRSASLSHHKLAVARRGLARLLDATAVNLASGPTPAAWTGPWRRGDAGTVISHRLASPPQLRDLYAALLAAGSLLLPADKPKPLLRGR